MTGEKLVGFGASFDGSGLVSTGTVRELVEGTEQEHVEEDVFALGGVTGGGQGFAPSSQSVYGAFEALAFDRGAQEQGALQHEATDQIVLAKDQKPRSATSTSPRRKVPRSKAKSRIS